MLGRVVNVALLLLFIVCLTFVQEKMLGKWSFLTPALNTIKVMSTKKCNVAVVNISVPAAAQFLHKQARAVLSSHSSVSETVISNVRAPMSAPSHKFCYLCLLLHHSATLLYYCLPLQTGAATQVLLPMSAVTMELLKKTVND